MFETESECELSLARLFPAVDQFKECANHCTFRSFLGMGIEKGLCAIDLVGYSLGKFLFPRRGVVSVFTDHVL